MKQVRFFDIDNKAYHGGIELDNGDVICGCCGGLFTKDEEHVTWELVKRYETWMCLDEEICGDEMFEISNEYDDLN